LVIIRQTGQSHNDVRMSWNISSGVFSACRTQVYVCSQLYNTTYDVVTDATV